MTDIEKLRALAKSTDAVQAFFEHLANRQKNYRVTTVHHGMRISGGSRNEIVQLFKQMAELGLGAFITGRRGGESRFEWSVGMLETAHAVSGETEEIEPIDEAELESSPEDEDAELIEHSYVLRKDTAPIRFALPHDLSAQEAQRLSKFILTLPLEE